MASLTLMITAASGPLVPQAIRLLKESRRHKVRVVAVDIRPSGAALHYADAFLPVPSGNASDYIDSVRTIAADEDVQLILPWSDEEALALAAARNSLEEVGIVVACAPLQLLQDMSDKAKAYARLSSLGLPVARWSEARDRAGIEAALNAIVGATGEAVIKPANSRGGRDIYVIRRDLSGAHPVNYGRETHLDMQTFMDSHLDDASKLAPVIVMERLFEPVFDIDVLAWRGEAKRVVPRRRHNPGGMPFEGNDVLADPKLIELGRHTAEAIGLEWLYDFDVMSDANGNPSLIELNPRPSGSMPVSMIAGVPLLDDLISLAMGEPLPEIALPVVQTVVPYVALSSLPLVSA